MLAFVTGAAIYVLDCELRVVAYGRLAGGVPLMNAPVTLPPKPQTVCGNLDNLPAVFWPYTQQKIWCVWSWTWVDGRWTKPPLQPSGRNAKSQGRETWCTYADAVAAVKSSRADGIGIMLYGMTSLEIAI